MCFASCREDGVDTANFRVDRLEGIIASPDGGTEYLQVTSTVEWIASANEP